MMEKYSVRNIVFSSSATVYSETNPLPWKEDGILATKNPYGTTKQVTELLLRDYAEHKWWHVMNLRYFNPIGAHSSGLIGENPQWIPNNLLPYIMKVVTWEQESVRIYGNDYDTPDGTGVRDYIHVVDLARGHLKAYEYIASHDEDVWYFESFNLWTGKGTSVLEIINTTSEILWYDLPYTILDRRDGDIAEFYCDPSRAYDILGWKTQYNVEDAIWDSIRFIRRFPRVSRDN
jgi:UDP-glucose 4-epimerase